MAVHSGDLHVNWGPQWRADLMPYGGVKDSEGPAYDVLDRTQVGGLPPVELRARRYAEA